MISPQNFIHPEDEAARRNMDAILGFAAAVKAFLKFGLEQYYHGINMASKIRLSEKQLPELYCKLPPICQKLNISGPEFYLEMNPARNAEQGIWKGQSFAGNVEESFKSISINYLKL
jgi:hypothetical protein